MVRFRITDDDDEEDEWDFVVNDEQSSMVPFVENERSQRPDHSIGEPMSLGTVPSATEEDLLGQIGQYYHPEDARRSHCGIFRSSLLFVMLGILVQAYLPPAPPPMNSNRHNENDYEKISWNAYLQSHSQQWIDSTKALMIDTPWHIVSWLGIAAFRDVQHYVEAASSRSTECSWEIPSSIKTIEQDLLRVIVGQDLAVSLVAEALVAWTAAEARKEPLKILSLGSKSTGKRSLANAIASYASCGESILYIPKTDPRSPIQKSRRMQQHIQQYETASMIIFHDDDVQLYRDIELENAGHTILYHISETSGRSIMAHSLRTNTWGSSSMLADLRTDVQWTSLILPFSPMTPEILGKIVRMHIVAEDEVSLLESVEFIDWTTKDGSLILRVALEGAQSLPWNRIHARKVTGNEGGPIAV